MKVLITGGAGFIGSHLGDAFLKRGDEVYVLDTSSDSKVQHNLGKPGFNYFCESVLDEKILDFLIGKVDIVYHLAAVVGVEHYVNTPLRVLDVNVNGVQKVLGIALKHNKKVVFSSTSEVYGRNRNVPFKEDDDRVLGPTRIDRWCYSTSKAVGEHFCFAYMKMGLQCVILRYFNVYGPRLDNPDAGRVMTIFIGQMLRNQPLTVIGDGSQTRCFTFVSDAMKATVAAGELEEAEGKVFNIGNDRETSILELAKTMIRVSNYSQGINFVSADTVYGDSYEDIPRRVPDISRQKNILKVTPSVSLEDGLCPTLEHFGVNVFPKLQTVT